MSDGHRVAPPGDGWPARARAGGAGSSRVERRITAARGRIRRLSPAEVAAYDLVPEVIARRAVVVRVPVLPPGAQGMTSGRFVFLRRDERADGGSTLLAHELVHVRQFADQGRLRFALSYFGAYLVNLVRYRGHRQAYLHIPQEEEAYSLSRRWRAAGAGRT